MANFLGAARGVAICALLLVAGPVCAQGDPLPSWNDGPTKSAIIEFVTAVTTDGGPDFVSRPERIAVFDNDGTLWAEKPAYVQLFFALDRIKALAPDHPEWQSQEPYASILKGDLKGALAGGKHAVAEIIAATHSGMTTDQFAQTVAEWFSTAENPETKRPFAEMAYQPMVELLAYLRDNDFQTFIVSGGGIDFMRVFSEQLYGVPPAQVVGSSGKLKFENQDGAGPVLVKLPEINFVDDGPGKPVGIQMHIGQVPILAFGNSDGDLEMLQYTCLPAGPSFCAFVHHTDAAREWAYDRKSDVGKLDKGLDAASANGWTLVDMKADWKTVFPKSAN